MRVGDQAAQGGPAGATGDSGVMGRLGPGGEHRDSGQARIDDRATTGGRARGSDPRVGWRIEDAAGHRQVDAEDGAQTRLGCRLHEAHRAIQAVAIGQGDGRLAILRGTLDQRFGLRRAISHGEAGGEVQVDELRHWPPSKKTPE